MEELAGAAEKRKMEVKKKEIKDHQGVQMLHEKNERANPGTSVQEAAVS